MASSVQLPSSQLHGALGCLLFSAFGFHLPPTLLALLPGQLGLPLPWEQEEEEEEEVGGGLQAHWGLSFPACPCPQSVCPDQKGKHSRLSVSRPSQLSSPHESGLG